LKPVRFHLAAEAELAAEAAYYDERSPGLGERFVTTFMQRCRAVRLNLHLDRG
jgi:hypothetical protein